MTEITQDIVEYATVERLSLMLSNAKEPYGTTESYALLSTILCWVIQRMRTPTDDNTPQGRLARGVARALKDKTILGSPPSLTEVRWPENTECDNGQLGIASAHDVFVAMRNAVAHGDARRVVPINVRGYLIGYEFSLDAIGHSHQVLLRREDMVSLGQDLARVFCVQMQMASDDRALGSRVRHLREPELACA